MSERPDSDGEPTKRRILCDIARTAFEVVNRLLERDQLLARNLRSEETRSRQIYREECITTEMAATLRERFPQHVEITLFTAHEEARTGADWYWRFERGDRAIHARVQAKRVRRLEFGQPDSNGVVEIDRPQLDALIQAAGRLASSNELNRTPIPGLRAWLATFARFDATPPCRKDDLSQCKRHNHERACADHGPSLWIAQASELLDLGVTRTTVRIVVEHSVRLDCILPCIDGPGAMDGPAKKGFTLDKGLPTFQECVDRIQKDPALLKSFEGAMRIFV
jgi:hypothetical protein